MPLIKQFAVAAAAADGSVRRRSAPPLAASRDAMSSGGGGGGSNVTSSTTVEDIDCDDADTCECIVEYVDDVFADLRAAEQRVHRALRPLAADAEAVRATLVRWMTDVRSRLKLRYDTLALAVALLDRYVSGVECADFDAQAPAEGGRLALAAATLMLAATLEEQFPPESNDFVLECRRACRSGSFGAARDGAAFSSVNLRKVSWRVATALDFDLWTPHYLHFLRRFSKASQHDTVEHNAAKQLCELAAEHYAALLLRHPPSMIAAAAVYLVRGERAASSNVATNHKPWTSTLRHYTGYARHDVACVANDMRCVLNDSNAPQRWTSIAPAHFF